MELAVRLSAALAALPGPGSAPGGGLVVGAIAAAAFLALGAAHHAGAAKRLADVWVFSPYLVLALGWLGAGTLLVLLATVLLPEDGSGPLTVVGLLVGAAGALAWLVGLVGLVWLPRRLRPRWLQERIDAGTLPGAGGGRHPRPAASRRAGPTADPTDPSRPTAAPPRRPS